MFVPVPGVATVELIHSLQDRPCEVTLHFYRVDGTIDASTLDGLATLVGLWWVDNILPWLSWDLHFLYARASDQSTFGGLFVDDMTLAGAGGTIRNAMPASVAAVISFQTSYVNQVSRNRNYIPGLPDTAVIGNRLHPEWMPHIFDGYVSLIDLSHGAGWPWVGVHRFNGSTPLSEGTFSYVTQVRFTRFTVGQRRKRLHNSFVI